MIEILPLLISFLIAYVGVSCVGFGIYMAVCNARGTSPWDEVEVRHNRSYQLVNRALPFLNLIVWMAAAWFYFSAVNPTWQNVYALASVWLIAALVIDYVAFVLIKHPLSVDHKGFYVGQAPWIYLTYFAVFAAPILYKLLFVQQ